MSYDGCPSVKLKTLELQELFPDDDCILVGDADSGGALTTPALWDAFALNPCHLTRTGEIMRFGKVIGSRSDIEIETMNSKAKP